MTDEEIKNTIIETVNNTKNFMKKNKISIIISTIAILIIAAGVFLGGFFTARKIYKIDNVDQQIMSLQNKLNEATDKLNEIQNRYDELIALNEEMNTQATLVKKDIEDALQIVDTSKVTIDEIKNLTSSGGNTASDARTLINTIIQNNAIIKDKVIILEKNLDDLKIKMSLSIGEAI